MVMISTNHFHSFVRKAFSLFFVMSASCLLGSVVYGQGKQLNAALRAATIESIGQLLKDKYAYPEVAAKMETELRARLKRGDYDQIFDGGKFAERLTADLRSIFDDKHLKLSFSVEPIPVRSGMAGMPSAEEIEQARIKQSRENFGLPKVEILKGNVGFIQINYFAPLSWSNASYTAAMNYVAHSDALIIDVRQNRGSMDINTIPFFCSYLFDQPVQIGDIFTRESNETRQLWTYAQVPGHKYVNKPIFILTSQRTASGAEGFVSGLKRLKRAVLVGETTAGASMPGGSHRVNDHFSIWISTGRSAAGTAGNENKGIEPHVAVPSDVALNEAHRSALDGLIRNADEKWKNELIKIRSELDDK